MKTTKTIPVIDLFAGPGGLGEGFSSLPGSRGSLGFDVTFSIEKEAHASRTLELRSFYRQFSKQDVPDEYYQYVRGEIDKTELIDAFPEIWKAAADRVIHATIGDKAGDKKIGRRLSELFASKVAPKHWILIGGPPCQAYSTIGRSRMNKFDDFDSDHRHTLYKTYLRIIAKYKPSLFVLENVRGILSSKLNGHPIFPKILKDLKAPSTGLGYSVYSLVVKLDNDYPCKDGSGYATGGDFLIESEHYGIPQKRHRVILFGVHNDLLAKSKGYEPPILKKKNGLVTIKQVIDDLPPLRSGLSRIEDTRSNWRIEIRKMADRGWLYVNKLNNGHDLTSYILKVLDGMHTPNSDRGGRFVEWPDNKPSIYPNWYYDGRLGGVLNHESRAHLGSDLHRYMFVSAFGRKHRYSPKLRHFPKWLLPNHSNAERAAQGHGNFNDRFRVQVMNEPGTTVTCHIAKDGHSFIHYDPFQCRSFTVREAARLQTFPDNYFFEGSRTEQYKQVGNAVPPLLARQIAKTIRQVLEDLI